jgi:hypothetical protein
MNIKTDMESDTDMDILICVCHGHGHRHVVHVHVHVKLLLKKGEHSTSLKFKKKNVQSAPTLEQIAHLQFGTLVL